VKPYESFGGPAHENLLGVEWSDPQIGSGPRWTGPLTLTKLRWPGSQRVARLKWVDDGAPLFFKVPLARTPTAIKVPPKVTWGLYQTLRED
jgi:hypothetical protein